MVNDFALMGNTATIYNSIVLISRGSKKLIRLCNNLDTSEQKEQYMKHKTMNRIMPIP